MVIRDQKPNQSIVNAELGVPYYITLPPVASRDGALAYQRSDQKVYVWKTTQWVALIDMNSAYSLSNDPTPGSTVGLVNGSPQTGPAFILKTLTQARYMNLTSTANSVTLDCTALDSIPTRSWKAGTGSSVGSADNVAVGDSADATGFSSTAVGSDAFAANGSTAVGYKAFGNSPNSTSLGTVSTAADNCTAVGYNAQASSLNSVAVGYDSLGTVQSTAVGHSSYGANEGVAIGYNALNRGDNTVAIGANSLSGVDGGIAIGHGATNTTPGSAKSIALGYNATTKNNQQVCIGHSAQTSLNDSTVVGYQGSISSTQSTGLGSGVNVADQSDGGTVVGYMAKIDNRSQSSVAVGSNSLVGERAQNSIALGGSATVADESRDSIAIGYQAAIPTSTPNAIAIGSDAESKGSDSVAIGKSSLADSGCARSIAIGRDAAVTSGADNAIALGSGALNTTSNTAMIGYGTTYIVYSSGYFRSTKQIGAIIRTPVDGLSKTVPSLTSREINFGSVIYADGVAATPGNVGLFLPFINHLYNVSFSFRTRVTIPVGLVNTAYTVTVSLTPGYTVVAGDTICQGKVNYSTGDSPQESFFSTSLTLMTGDPSPGTFSTLSISVYNSSALDMEVYDAQISCFLIA